MLVVQLAVQEAQGQAVKVREVAAAGVLEAEVEVELLRALQEGAEEVEVLLVVAGLAGHMGQRMLLQPGAEGVPEAQAI